MQSFGKAIRNSLPAVGLGLISAFGLAATAPAALAQKNVSKEFAENYKAAQDAYTKSQFAVALQKADAAWPHASDAKQKAAVEALRVGASCAPANKNHAGCISAIEKAKATGGNAGSMKNWDQMLAGRYADAGQAAKAVAQTKANIAAYGGSAAEYAFVAKSEINAKNFAEAEKTINKAIAAGKPTAAYYNILLNALQGQNKMDDFYKTVEKIAPIYNQEIYWRTLIEHARSEKTYRSSDAQLDLYRALEGARVQLKTTESYEMADAARKRGFNAEAVRIWSPLFASGALGGASDKDAARNKSLFETVKKAAEADKTSLAKNEADATTRATGEAYAQVAEYYLGSGDAAKSADLFQKALAKGGMDAGVADLVRLRLGQAQFKAGKKADAVKTWQSIKADNGAAWLARCWIAISKA